MAYLLDTHTALWFVQDDPQLPEKLRNLISTTPEPCWVSLASFWEVGIKYSLGKLQLDMSLPELLSIWQQSGFELCSISPGHVVKMAELPWHHRDPFDRIIIAQGISEGYSIISRDGAFDQYLAAEKVKRIW